MAVPSNNNVLAIDNAANAANAANTANAKPEPANAIQDAVAAKPTDAKIAAANAKQEDAAANANAKPTTNAANAKANPYDDLDNDNANTNDNDMAFTGYKNNRISKGIAKTSRTAKNILSDIVDKTNSIKNTIKGKIRDRISYKNNNELKIAKLENKTKRISANIYKKNADRALKLGDLSRYSEHTEEDTKDKKGDITIDYYEKFTKPLFYKFYPIFAIILCFLTLIIFIISLLNIILFIASVISNGILIIFNDDIINYNLMPYRTIYNYINNVSDDNFSKEPYFIYTEQYIVYKNIYYWFIGFLSLFIPLVLYIILKFVYMLKGDNYKLKGADKSMIQRLVLIIMGVTIIYLIIHSIIYSIFFKNFVYTKFKDIVKYNSYIDDTVVIPSLYKDSNVCNQYTQNIQYYELLERGDITDINTFINDKIQTDNLDAENIIFTYVLYRYFIDITGTSNKSGKELIKKYLTNTKGNDKLITFIGLINSKKKIIKKYYTELDFLEKNIGTKTESVATIKNNIDNKINTLNKLIINSPDTTTPILYLFAYMVTIFIFNSIFIGILIIIITKDNSDQEQKVFPDSIKNILTTIKDGVSSFITSIKDFFMSLMK